MYPRTLIMYDADLLYCAYLTLLLAYAAAYALSMVDNSLAVSH